MDSIVEKLSEIESTAEAIVEHAETRKYEIEKQIQAKRDKFDQDLETETMEKIAQIRAEADEKISKILEEQRQKNQSTIDFLNEDFKKNSTAYAMEILKHITEV